jgi:hypothetical protein
MHMTIGAIVYAEDSEEANDRAETIFSGLCVEEGPFDYYGIEGKPIGALTKTGGEIISRLHRYTKTEFIGAYRNLILELIGKTPEEVFEQPNGTLTCLPAKYWANKLGEYKGSNTWLYDSDGEGIRDTDHLESALNKWACLFEQKGKENPYADDKIWIVCADVHH